MKNDCDGKYSNPKVTVGRRCQRAQRFQVRGHLLLFYLPWHLLVRKALLFLSRSLAWMVLAKEGLARTKS
jgi:hypothetical protein